MPNHVPPLHRVQAVEAALTLFRQSLSPQQQFPPLADPSTAASGSSAASPGLHVRLADPYYVLLHANLLTAEMLTWREMANYDGGAYHRSIACARGVVQLVTCMKPEHWLHVGKSSIYSGHVCHVQRSVCLYD